jgi:hypothetical protein
MKNEKAFPNPHLRDDSGMTLRDYFAAKAMQAFLRNQKPENTDEPPSTWAEDAYTFADAMLKAREA